MKTLIYCAAVSCFIWFYPLSAFSSESRMTDVPSDRYTMNADTSVAPAKAVAVEQDAYSEEQGRRKGSPDCLADADKERAASLARAQDQYAQDMSYCYLNAVGLDASLCMADAEKHYAQRVAEIEKTYEQAVRQCEGLWD